MPIQQERFPGSQTPNAPKGVQTSVMGDYSGAAPSALTGPTAFGYDSGTQLPTAMVGMLGDIKATLTETRNVLQQVVVSNQRIVTMMGDVAASNVQVASALTSSMMGMSANQSQSNMPMMTGANLKIPGTNQAHAAFSAVTSSTSDIAPGTSSGWQSPAPTAIRTEAGDLKKDVVGEVGAGILGAVTGAHEEERHTEQAPPDAVKAAHDIALQRHQQVREAVEHPSLRTIGTAAQSWVRNKAPTSALGQKILGAAGETGAIGDLASGSGLSGAVAGVAGSGLLAGGLAALVAGPELYSHLGDVVSGYRNEGQQYQAVEGGSEVGGLVTTMRSKLFGIQNAFGMGDSEAQQLFQGVTNITGSDTGARANYLEFAKSQWQDLGMSVAQSLQVVTAAAQHGQDNLNGVAAALNNVTQAAVGAGSNAEEARGRFIQAYGANLSTGLGDSSAGIASQGASIITSTGDFGKGIGGAGTLSTNSIAYEASTLGITPAEMEMRLREGYGGKSGSAYSAQVQQGFIQHIVGQDGSLSGVTDIARNTKLKMNSKELNNQLLHAANAAGIYDPHQIEGMMSLMGLQGTNDLGKDLQAYAAYTHGAYHQGFTKENTQYATGTWLNQNNDRLKNFMSAGGAVKNNKLSALANASTGVINNQDVSEALAYMNSHHAQATDLQDVLHSDQSTQMFELAGGKKFSLKQIMADPKMIGQLANGSAHVIGANGKTGETVADWAKTLKGGNAAKTFNPSTGKGGTGSKASKNAVQVTVTAKPPLDQLLQFATTNGGNNLLSSQVPPDPYPAVNP